MTSANEHAKASSPSRALTAALPSATILANDGAVAGSSTGAGDPGVRLRGA